MYHAALKNKNKPSILLSNDILIAAFTLTFILLHILLRYVFHMNEFWQNIPLYASLAIGGIPIVYSLTIKFFKFEFSSDLLAGISIVTAVILEQYLAGALVVLMLSGGQTLELFAIRRASFLLEALSKRMPSSAHRKKNGIFEDVPIDEIEIGDALIVSPHEICPIDGDVIEGHGVMDESYLTGEPFFISKTPGSKVLSGSINGDSMLIIQANKKASDSRYAKIMQVMLESEQKKPHIRRLGDILGAYYTPIALALGIAAWIASGEAMRFLAVVVIATPCPLLIAIPVAIIGAISLSARHAIVIKNPAVLEQIDKCRTIIFDKTGTLTYGQPTLTDQVYFSSLPQNQVLGLAASVEHYSKHPLASAIIEAAKTAHITMKEASQISEKPGEGLTGIVDNHAVTITSRSHLHKLGKIAEANQLPQSAGLECLMLVDHQLAALFRFHDTPRLDSRTFVTHLKPMHHFDRIMIVSGDREEEVRYLAEEIGITEIYANQSPEEKVKIVEGETKNGPTIYLGDGINDAPALTVATVGIAFGQNSDITAEAADAVMMDNSLEKVDVLLHISRRMRKIALQSAVGGMALSVVGMLIAAFGYLPPVAGAISQEVIDVFAVLNALRVAFPKKKLTDF
ncbi:MAG: heavy metal translocating P-type ATPase [Chlamydiales bacterium]